MKQFIMGTLFGILLMAAVWAGNTMLGIPVADAGSHETKELEVVYSNVDFNYNGLVLYDIGLKVNDEIYVKPKKLMQFMGKDIQFGEEESQIVINERPENRVTHASVEAIGKTDKQTIGQMLGKKFLTQHWEAIDNEEGIIVFRGTNSQDEHIEIEFIVKSDEDMSVRKIYKNGIALNDREKDDVLQKLFSK